MWRVGPSVGTFPELAAFIHAENLDMRTFDQDDAEQARADLITGDQAVRNANERAAKAISRVHEGPGLIWFTKVASATSHAAGRPTTFVLCCLVILIWGVSGPVFHYSDTWQLIINTGTTIVTFLMVFLIQNTQNRDGAAVQAKLNELIRATRDARNAYMGIENLPEEEVESMREGCADSDTA
jgi:low affinity Fe/Cu permease